MSATLALPSSQQRRLSSGFSPTLRTTQPHVLFTAEVLHDAQGNDLVCDSDGDDVQQRLTVRTQHLEEI